MREESMVRFNGGPAPARLGSALSRLVGKAARFFRHDQSGAMVVEFAFITPVLMMVMLSCMDLGRLILAYQKTQVTANTVGDLVSRAEPAQNTETGVCSALQAANHVLRPFVLGASDSILVQSVTIEGQGEGAVVVRRDWEVSLTGTSASCTIIATEQTLGSVPLGLVTSLDDGETDNIIHTRINYQHDAWFWSFLDSDPSQPIVREAIHKPRIAPLANLASG